MDAEAEVVILQPSPRHSPKPTSNRKARPSSIRFSQDLDALLSWEGLSRFEKLSPNHFDHDNDEDCAHTRAGPIFDDYDNDDHDDNVHILADDDEGDFSGLSLMLASAKRKLDLLEGNLRGARDSLFIPSLPSPVSTTASFRSSLLSNGYTVSPTLSDNEEDEAHSQVAVRAQRITSAPLQHIQYRSPGRKMASHNRYNSETSQPSNISTAFSSPARSIRSPKSPRHHLHKSSMDLLRDQPLDAVTEDEILVPQTWTSHTRQASSQASIASTQVLHSQAQVVRKTLQKLKRLSLDAPPSSPDAATVRKEMQMLEANLARQEEGIAEIEEVIHSPKIPLGKKRALLSVKDYEQYYAHNRLDEHREVDEVEDDSVEHQSYSDDSDLEQYGVGHRREKTPDPFDYEEFILKSALGIYHSVPTLDHFSSISSLASVPASRRKQQDKQEIEPRVAAVRTSAASSRCDSYDSDRLVSDSLATSWPVPPASSKEPSDDTREVVPIPQVHPVVTNAISNTPTENTTEEPQHTQANAVALANERHQLSYADDQDATSVILSALLATGPETTPNSALSRDDQTLLFSLASALRTACMTLDQDGEAGRRRLVQATNMLRAEA